MQSPRLSLLICDLAKAGHWQQNPSTTPGISANPGGSTAVARPLNHWSAHAQRSKTDRRVGCRTVAATLVLSACTKKNEETAASTAGGTTAASGVRPSGAPASAAGAKVKVAFVPKLQGVPYFEAMNAGGKAAAEALATSNGCTRARPRPTPPPRPTSSARSSSRRSTR